MIGTIAWVVDYGMGAVGHNRLSAFGVIGTISKERKENDVLMSQSPFGFWGDWNFAEIDDKIKIHSR